MNKNIAIDKELHQKMKEYCAKKGFFVKSFVEKIIKQNIE